MRAYALKEVGLVVPVRNEEAVLPALWRRLEGLRERLCAVYRLSIVFVDDASTDGSTAFLRRLAQTQPNVELVAFSDARGQQQALCAGLDVAPGDVVVTLDADLQDPPECIEQMLLLWRGGADIVYGVRLGRAGDSLIKRLCAASYYRLLDLVSSGKVIKDCGDFRLVDRRVLPAIWALPRHRPYLRGRVVSLGYVQVPFYYLRAPRWAGHSAYCWLQMFELAWAGLLSCGQPVRLTALIAGLLGMVTMILGLCGLCLGRRAVAGMTAMPIACGLSLALARRRTHALHNAPDRTAHLADGPLTAGRTAGLLRTNL